MSWVRSITRKAPEFSWDTSSDRRLLIAFSFVFVNLIVDLLYAWLDPRISYR